LRSGRDSQVEQDVEQGFHVGQRLKQPGNMILAFARPDAQPVKPQKTAAIPGVWHIASILCGGSGGSGNRASRCAADVDKPVARGNLDDCGGVYDTAGDPALHHQVAAMQIVLDEIGVGVDRSAVMAHTGFPSFRYATFVTGCVEAVYHNLVQCSVC
jgi:hypothetical protein